ncbi:MAG: tetratricopeptide repeat protein [Candidatus Kapabacteria bacterium]|nr:tetratricopeptide repeat protein [Candidatus Kapabacteria bacterium]
MTLEEIKQALEKLDNLWRTSQYEEAKTLAFELLRVIDIHNDSESLASLYNYLGLIHSDLSDLKQAEEYLEKALSINKRLNNEVGISANLSNLGIVFNSYSHFSKAKEYYESAKEINERIGRKDFLAHNLNNIGIIYKLLSDYAKALEYLEKSLQINEEIGNKYGVGNVLGSIGNVYNELHDYNKAISYFEKAIIFFESIGYKVGIAAALGNIGTNYYRLTHYTLAIEYCHKSLQINEEIGKKEQIAHNIQNIGNIYNKISDYAKAIEFFEKALYINLEIENKVDTVINLISIGNLFLNNNNYLKAKEYQTNAYALSLEIGSKNLQMECLQLSSQINEKMNDTKSAFLDYKEFIALKDEIQTEEAKNKAQLFDQRRKLEEDEKARQLKLARFQEQEKILHNILPVKIADRILQQETFIADHFETVSVLFMDLVGFTSLASIAPPKQLVYLLDAIFQKADDIVEKFGLEKIKTIGDGYLAVANVTSPLDEHQKATALAALKLLETMRDFSVNIPSNLGDTDWIKEMNNLEIRIGIHTGEVVAGIIGKNKYTYDLWGDAVNVASRMESNSEAGRIHISEAFAKAVKSNPEFSIIPRGEIFIKGKGSMNTFWLEKAK